MFSNPKASTFIPVTWLSYFYPPQMVATIFTDKFQTYGSLARYLEFTCSRERKRDRENQFQRPVAPSEARALELF